MGDFATSVRGSRRGFTFLEVCVAIALFSIVAAGITTAVVSNTKLTARSNEEAAAEGLVAQKVEQLRAIVSMSDTIPPPELTVGVHNDPANPITPLGGSAGQFTRSWTVGYVPQFYNGTVVGNTPGIVKVSVSVRWTAKSANGAASAQSLSNITYACVTPNCG